MFFPRPEPRTVRNNRSHQLPRGRRELHQAEERLQADHCWGLPESAPAAATPPPAPAASVCHDGRRRSNGSPVPSASGGAPHAVGRTQFGGAIVRVAVAVQGLRAGTAAAGRLPQRYAPVDGLAADRLPEQSVPE